MIDDGTCYRCPKTKYHDGPCEEIRGTMSEQQVLPELIATLKAAADKAEIGEWQVVRGKGGEGWTICSLGDDRDGNPVSIETMGVRGSQLRCSILNDAEFFVAASPENILKLLASLAQSEAERERLQGELDSAELSIAHTLTYGGFDDDPLPAPETMTDEQLDKAWEYGGDKCRCWHCHWFRYIKTLRAELAREREANQGLREVVKEYRATVHRPKKPSDPIGPPCQLCIKADILLGGGDV